VAKLIILSIVLFPSIVPAFLAATSQPRRWLKRIQIGMFFATILWAYYCRTWYPQLVWVE
jgi:hypothetical protein